MNNQNVIDALLNQDLASAHIDFEIAMENSNGNELELLGDALLRLGFIQWAQKAYEKVKMLMPQQYSVNLSLAEIAIEEGESIQAFEYLFEIPKEDEHYVNGLMLQADLYEDEGNVDVAENKLIEALQYTDEPLVQLGLAEIQYVSGKFSAAIQNYAKLDAHEILEETRVSIFERIGTCYAYLGKYEHAISFYEKALEAEVSGKILWELANLYYSLTEFDKANIYFGQLMTFEPDFEGFQYLYAKSLVQEELIEEAYQVIQDGLKHNNYQSKMLHLASEIAYRLHLLDDAEDFLWQAYNLADLNEETINRLSTLLLERNKYEDAYQLLLSEDEPEVMSNWNLAKVYHAKDEIELAMVTYNLVYTDLADDPEFLKDYALFLHANGLELSKTIHLLKQYLTIEPNDFEIIQLLENIES